MKIALQDTQIEYREFEESGDALQELGEQVDVFGLRPFTDTFYHEPFTEPTVLFGSTKLVKMWVKGVLPTNSVVFYDPERFDQAYYHQYLKRYLLNETVSFLPYGKLKNRYLDCSVFIKPSTDLKLFKGTVLFKCDNTIGSELESQLMIDTDLNDDSMLLYTTNIITHTIICEYRAFVVNHEIIDICRYMENGRVAPLVIPIDTYNWIVSFIQHIQKIYEPHAHYVIDVASVREHIDSPVELKVVEYNCINCSGNYAIDRKKVFQAILDLPSEPPFYKGTIMNNQAALFKALLAGEVLIFDNKSGHQPNLIKMIDNEIVSTRIDEAPYNWIKITNFSVFYDTEYFEIYKEPKWYDVIPEYGILCWVTNTSGITWVEVIVRTHPSTDQYAVDGVTYHTTRSEQFFKVQPLSPSQIQEHFGKHSTTIHNRLINTK